MRTIIALPVVLSLSLTACGGGSPPTAVVDASAAREAQRHPASQVRPITGRCVLTFTPPPLPLPPQFRQVDTGTCQLSHLGRTAFEGVQVIDFAAGSQRGERTLTAANGDVLRSVHVGTSQPSGPGLISFVASMTIVGGTGRFANATGQVRGVGTANLATRTTEVELDGWIAYDASDRSGR